LPKALAGSAVALTASSSARSASNRGGACRRRHLRRASHYQPRARASASHPNNSSVRTATARRHRMLGIQLRRLERLPPHVRPTGPDTSGQAASTTRGPPTTW